MPTFERKTRSAKYNRLNPPPNEESARQRIDQITKIIERINAELEHTRPDEFETDDDFFGWKGSAAAAIGHYKHELRFLEEWLKPPAVVKVSKADAEMLQRVRDKVAELADLLESEYAPVYSDACPPPSLSVARERLLVLGSMSRKLTEAFAEAGNLWSSHTLSKQALAGIRAPLQGIVTELSEERSAVKNYIRVKSVELNARPGLANWQGTCLDALKRAVASGFQLTEVEREVLERMEAHQKFQLEEIGPDESKTS